MFSHKMCNGIYKSGIHKNQPCNCRAWINSDFCGRHQSQWVDDNFSITIINKIDRPVAIYNLVDTVSSSDDTVSSEDWHGHAHYPDLVCNVQSGHTIRINTYSNDITKYFISYCEFEQTDFTLKTSEYYLSEKDIIIINKNEGVLIVPSPHKVKKYKELCGEWKKVALKALHLPKEIKKLTNSDTVKEMCDMTEYIDLPEEITERDYQLAGATYNPDDEFNPGDYDEGEVDEPIELDVTEIPDISVSAIIPTRYTPQSIETMIMRRILLLDSETPNILSEFNSDNSIIGLFSVADAEDVD